MTHRGTYDGTIYHNPVNKFCIISVKTADKEVPQEARSTHRYNTRGFSLSLAAKAPTGIHQHPLRDLRGIIGPRTFGEWFRIAGGTF